ncbi:MAG: hypothetical protein ACXWPM_12315, partial [Bdellovibrionota bacterium]
GMPGALAAGMHLELNDSEIRLVRMALDSEIRGALQELSQMADRSRRETLEQDLQALEQIKRRLAIDAVVTEDQVAS